MRVLQPLRKACLVLAAMLALAACKSAEERAEERFQSGVTLAEAGDVDRAIVELRSVFELLPSHLEARRLLARLLLEEKNNPPEAYAQYLRLSEQYPDDLDARLVLAELAFAASSWEEFDRHGEAAIDLSPEDPRVLAVTTTKGYRRAIVDDDAALRRDQARQAEAQLEALPQSKMLQRIVIDNYLREGNFDQAISRLDTLLELEPDNMLLWEQRQAILLQQQDFDGLEDQLRLLIERFPEDNARKAALIQFLIGRDRLDDAELFLRRLVEETSEEQIRVDLVRFLSETRGPEAAREELRAAIADHPEAIIFKVLQAGLDFSLGEREIAVAAIEDVLREHEVPSEEVNRIKTTLAQMHLQMGNEVAARRTVEEILANDPTSADALKMQAAWQIEADETDQAIAGLRVALDQNENDIAAMELMAQAYMRAGQNNLARDFLALAVDASSNAPPQTIRYASILIDDESYLPAEDLLLAALRRDPQNQELLTLLGQVYLGIEDFGRGEQVVQALRGLDIPAARDLATRLEAELINRERGSEQALAYLEDLAESADATLTTQISLLRARLVSGDLEGALSLARDMQASAPDNLGVQAMLATTETANGNFSEAQALYRTILESEPRQPRIWIELARLAVLEGDQDAARALIDEGLAQLPNSADLLWAKASYLERDGDVDGAIDIYDELYTQNSNSAIVANNLASLLSTYRQDEDSLERAWRIARRFRDVENPAIQDTYGWIAHRRGDSEEALPYLEAAAQGLPADPIVQFHLAEVYAALDRRADALRQYQAALEVAGANDQRRQILRAREQVARLTAEDLPNE